MNLFHSSFYVFIGQQASVPAQQGSTHGNDMHHLNYFSHYYKLIRYDAFI